MKTLSNFYRSLHIITKFNLLLTYVFISMLCASVGALFITVLMYFVPLCLLIIWAIYNYAKSIFKF